MDTKSGMQLGICWVKFDGPVQGRSGTAHDVAAHVVKTCDGQRVGLSGNERIKVVFDGRGLRTEKAVKEEMERRYKPKPKPVVQPPTGPKAAMPAAPPTGAKEPPKPEPPRFGLGARPPPPRPLPKFDSFGRNYSSLSRSLPSRAYPPMAPGGSSYRPMQPMQDFSRDFRAPPLQRRGDLYSPQTSRSRSVSSYSSDSDDDERPGFRRRGSGTRSPSPTRPARGQARAAVDRKGAEEAAVEKVKTALADNGKAYVFIDTKSLPYGQAREEHVKDHFRAFKPEAVLHNHVGWYVLFSDDQAAHRAQRVLDKTAVQGHRVGLVVKTPAAKANGEAAVAVAPEKGGWRFLTITKKRPVAAPVPAPTKPRPPTSPKRDMHAKSRRRRSISYSSSDSEAERPVAHSGKKVIQESESEDEALATKPGKLATVSSAKDKVVAKAEPMAVDKTEPEPAAPKGKKRPSKAADKPTKAKKVKLEDATVSVDITPDAAVAEIKLPVAKPKAPKKPPKTAVDDLVASGAIADDEDAYWLSQALAAGDDEPELSDGEPELDEAHPLFHTAGAWRAEGWKKIAPISKSAYLPQRNRATADAKQEAQQATGRTARITSRRQAQDMEGHRKAAGGAAGASGAAATETDLFAFNQLRSRKKQLRFARSAIEGYGLYAMETIQAGEMVCEYVGELCRSSVADIREMRYLKQGIGSSYLFRIDGDVVCDATFTGSVSRLINHSCDPSANAKIISINGQSKIGIFAKRTLHPGEEVS